MAKKILVLLDSKRDLEESLPAIERIASRGTRVIFLFRYPVESFRWTLARLQNKEVGISTRRELGRIGVKYGWDEQKKIAEQKIASARDALATRGIRACVDLYTDPLERAIQKYTAAGDVRFVLAPEGFGRFLSGYIRIPWKRSRGSFFLPVLILQPEASAGR